MIKMKNILFTAVLLSLFINVTFAQKVTIPIETSNLSIVLQTENEKHLRIIHTGKKLKNSSEYEISGNVHNLGGENSNTNNYAFSVAGIHNFIEPSIAVVHTDGNNSLDLIYENHKTTTTSEGATLTTITLKDPVYPFYVDINYKSWNENDVIEQWTVIRHSEKGKVILNKYASANLYLYDKGYYLTSYNGSWAKEMQPAHTQLQQGMHTIQTRLGTRENLNTSPNFMLSIGGQSTENSGTVMMGQIAWNGNFSIQFETDSHKNMHIVAGINPYQSSYQLEPNVQFETPHFVYTVSFEGMGKGSRNLQSWLRNNVLLDGQGERLTLLNNWEATYFGFNQEQLVGLFDGAKKMGVDLFLLDDGWFGNKYPRDNDKAGLGDWEVNKSKLPDGIPYLVEEATKKGLKFGIWIEAEMVNPKSELYENHPDWVLRQEARPEVYYRNQLVLDLANPDVQDYVFGIVDKLFTENPSLAFIKWDCNAPIFNAHSKYLEKKKISQSNFYVEYTRGFEKVLKRLRAKYPEVPIMLCSGGGGRSDYSLFKYFTEFWPSDNTDPVERVFLQWDYSYYYPAITMCAHVTDWSNKPLKYRIDVASMGKLGFDIRANELSDKDMTFCQQTIQNYDKLKDIVWHGDLYRLLSPYENELASLMYVTSDKSRAVMFNYLSDWRYVGDPQQRPIKLQGLDSNKTYRLTEINLYDKQRSPIDSSRTYSGDFLMKVGFNPSVNLSRTSVVISIEAI